MRYGSSSGISGQSRGTARLGTVAAALIASALISPPEAVAAAVTYTGFTSHGHPVTVTVSDGVAALTLVYSLECPNTSHKESANFENLVVRAGRASEVYPRFRGTGNAQVKLEFSNSQVGGLVKIEAPLPPGERGGWPGMPANPCFGTEDFVATAS